jgi:hypothetical protein
MKTIQKNVRARSALVMIAALVCLWLPILIVRLAGNPEVGGLLLILFLICPLISLLSGVVFSRVGGTLWMGLVCITAAHLVLIFALFNSSALVYVPVYMILFLVGYKLPQWIRKFLPTKKAA